MGDALVDASVEAKDFRGSRWRVHKPGGRNEVHSRLDADNAGTGSDVLSYWRETMPADPNTIGLILLFIVVFLACILWATGGTTSVPDPHEEDIAFPGKTS